MNARLEEQLTALINQFCEENVSNTPDFILAKYLVNCLENFHVCVNLREQWFDRMTDGVLDDEDAIRFSSSIDDTDEYVYPVNNLDSVVSTNFLEEKKFIATDYVHLSVMLMDIENRPGQYYDFFDDALIVAVVKPNGLVVIKTDPLVGDVLEMLK